MTNYFYQLLRCNYFMKSVFGLLKSERKQEHIIETSKSAT